jgi:hypothetical protein
MAQSVNFGTCDCCGQCGNTCAASFPAVASYQISVTYTPHFPACLGAMPAVVVNYCRNIPAAPFAELSGKLYCPTYPPPQTAGCAIIAGQTDVCGNRGEASALTGLCCAGGAGNYGIGWQFRSGWRRDGSCYAQLIGGQVIACHFPDSYQYGSGFSGELCSSLSGQFETPFDMPLTGVGYIQPPGGIATIEALTGVAHFEPM